MQLDSEMVRSRLVQDDPMVVVVHVLAESSLECHMEVLEWLLILAHN
jgi:hypothetical protein